MKISNYLLLLGTVSLSACSSLPLPVKDTPMADSVELPFGPVRTFDEVKGKFKGYYLTYMEEAKVKRASAQSASEVGFYGAVLGVVGGMAKNVGTAIAGGVIGSGAGLYSDRYRLQVQAQSYEASADAMLCMYLASQDISEKSAKQFTFSDSGQSGELAVRDIAIDGLLRVRDKLYKLQTNFEIGKPDPNKLKDALAATPKNLASKGTSLFSVEESTKTSATLATYKSQIDQCVAKTAG